MTDSGEPCGAVRMLTYDEVASQLGISIRQVYNLVESGKLPRHKLGDRRNSPVRIAQSDVRAYLESTRDVKVSTGDTGGGDDRSGGTEGEE